MRVRDFLVSSRTHLFKPEDTVKYAVSVFSDLKIDASPVVNPDGVIVGLFTKSHVFKAIKNGVSMETPLSGLMTKNVIAGHPDDSVEDRFYFKHGYLPVVENGKAVGIVAIPDFVKTFHDWYKMTRNITDAIINSSKNLIISIDTDEKITLVNQSAADAFGRDVEDLAGIKIKEILPFVELGSVMKSGDVPPVVKVTVNERAYINRSYPIWFEGKIIGAVAIFQDIQDLEKIVMELESVKELNRDLQAIIESSADGIFVCDGDANVLRVNQAYQDITGLDISTFYGRNMRDLVADGTYSQSTTLLVLEKNAPVNLIQKTSTGKSLLVSAKPVYNESGKISRVVSSVRDVTELFSLEGKLQDAEKMTEEFRKELDSLRIRNVKNVEGMIVSSDKMNELVDTAIRLAKVDSTIMITGESGTGKELIAGIIHKYSTRNEKPFIKVNCGAIPPNLLESELFGYEEGAFTGAKKGGKPGYFEIADTGTLFLDEIGEIPYELQAKMLRVLQQKELNRVGGQKFRSINVRIIAATNRDLMDMVKEKLFREDLYYRLNVVPLFIPPLRERREDIKFLTSFFLKTFNENFNMKKRLSPDLVDKFEEYSWPGNIRELRNLVERLIVMCPEDIITIKDLPSNICAELKCYEPDHGLVVNSIMPMKEALENVEKQLIERAYKQYSTTRQMAQFLKISAPSIVRKAAKYGITKQH
jgi:PAS domain S-box-containing protein/TyrR family helix-turn-helix protein